MKSWKFGHLVETAKSQWNLKDLCEILQNVGKSWKLCHSLPQPVKSWKWLWNPGILQNVLESKKLFQQFGNLGNLKESLKF